MTATSANRGGHPHAIAGIALMAAASLMLPLVDGLAKALTASQSPFFIAWARYVVATLIVVPATLALGRPLGTLRTDFASNALRTALLVGANATFFIAIALVPFATAFGGYFLGPAVAAVLAAWLLGERITPWRLAAGLAGFAGSLLVVRPGVEIGLGGLSALLCGALYAGYLVTTRMTARATPPLDTLKFQCVFGALLLTPPALLQWSWPTAGELLLLAAMGVLSVVCHFLVIASFRYAEAAVLSPLIYLELVTALLIGRVIFGETPDLVAGIGIALIVAGGLAIVLTERRGAA